MVKFKLRKGNKNGRELKMKIFVFKAMLKERGITDKMTAGLLGVSVATFRRRLKDGSFLALWDFLI